MTHAYKIKLMKSIVVVIFIGPPVLVMFYDVAAGVLLLLLGAYITSRAIGYIGSRHLELDETHQQYHTNGSSKTILVQIVDDFGRELPPREVEKRLADARSKADPRDSVVGVNFKVNASGEKNETPGAR
jgi:hypothetical protein